MDFQRLTELLDHFLTLGIPCTDCAVYLRGAPVFRHYNGCSDIEAGTPLAPDALWQIFSVSKVVTCTAALQLYERGAFLLDDPLSAYLPEFREMCVRESDGTLRPARNPILIQDLFTMSGGFTYNLGSDNMRAGVAATDGRAPTREMMKYLARDPLIFDPGTGWEYSLCHDVLGALVEVLSGQTLDAFIQDHICAPLGLKDLTFHPTPEQLTRLVPVYDYDWDARAVRPCAGMHLAIGPEYESGGGGLYASTADCAAFGAALAGGKLLSRRTVDLMRANRLSTSQLAQFRRSREPGIRKANERLGYGYGLGVRTMLDPAEGGSNGPAGEFGWGGALGAYLLLDAENDLALYYSQSTMRPPAEYTRSRLRNVLYACL